ncbi:MAG: InlB B-repeat-containing protein, partial [Oscillospiraceae bacterium]|nr:InlB B-repeat-containing protein [Oscillospiraceae bacterium]
MKKILIIALILVFALQLMPFTASAADAPTQLWVEPSDTNGIPARIDVFKMKTGSTSTTYTYQVYLPGNAVPANCFLSWDGGATVTINGTPYESGACPLPQVGTETTYDFKNGNQSLASLKIVVYQGSPNVQSVFIEINESLGTIAAMDNDINHNTVCSGTIFINGVQYELTKMKGRGNATWTGSEDKKPYNITLGKKINFPGINSEKTKKWSFLAEITDHSLLSNRSGYHLAYELGIGQDTTSADVWMNGEYQGCYTVTPKTDSFVTKNGFMIEQDNYKEPSVANGGDPQFSLEGLVSHVESSTWTSSYNYITVKKMGDNLLGQNEAGETDESPENLSAKAAEIQKWLQDAWDAIRSDDGYNSKGKYYTDYIDIESFAKMYLMHEYAKSYDVCAGSILFHRDGTSDEFKLIAGPMWDLDNAMGSTCQNSYLGNADDRRNGDRRSAEGYFIANISNYRNYGSEYKTSIYKTISKHADFVEEVNRQYNKYRSAFDNLENDVAQMISDIADSARMNHIKVNDISGTYKNVHKYSSATTLGSGEYRQTYLATTNSKTDWANYAANLKTYIHARSLWFYNTYYDENYVCVHEYDAVVTPPTCTAKGYTTYTCKYCGESYVDDYTPIIAHNYQDGACTVCGQTLLNVSISCAGGASVTVYETKDTTGPCMENAQLAHPRNGDTGLIDCSGDGQVNFVVNLLSGYTLESVTAEPEGSYNKLKTLEDAGIENGYRITKVTGDLTIIVKVSGTVTFNANGGTGEMEAQPVTMGEEATLPKNGFTRTGYTFVGWNTKADGSGTAYTDKAKVNLTENTVLYAQWKVDQHTITFDTAGGSEIAPITADYGTAVTAPAAPTKTGYTFSGWSPALPATMPAENMTVTAQWTINQYTLTFDTAGGSAVAPITADYGAPVTAPAAPTRTGYTFDGWDKAIPETMPAEDLTITAKWKINRYTITFDTAGGSEIAPITADYGTAVTAPAAPTKTGYTFSGWSPALPATM